MAGEALQAKATSRDDQVPFTLELFAAVLLRAPFDPLGRDDARIVSWAQAEAARMDADGRAPHGAQVMALRLIYASLREQAADRPTLDARDRAPRWEDVFRAACNLKHRQRSALTAYYCAALPEPAVAAVIGTSPKRAREVIEGAVAGVARALNRPVDIRRSLRMASARLEAARTAEPPALTSTLFTKPDPSQPREVIRNWITAPVTSHESLRERIAANRSVPLVIPRGSPVQVLLASGEPLDEGVAGVVAPRARPAPRPASRPAAPTPVARQLRARRWPAALAAAAAMLVLAVLAPVTADDGPARATEPDARVVAPVIQAERPEVKGVRLIRVRPGDSLWAIAARELDDPLRWTEIWRRNRGGRMSGGERFTSASLIRPGWTLELPRGRPR